MNTPSFVKVAVAAGALALSFQSHAGFYYQARNTTGSESSTMEAWVEGDSARIQVKEGDQMGFLGKDGYMLTHDAGDTMILVNPEEKTWSEFDFGATMNMANTALQAMGGMMQMEFGDFYTEKLEEAPGGELLGYDTRYVHMRSGYTMKMSIMGRNMDQKVDMDQEFWVTDAIDAAAFSAWLRPDKRLKGMFEGLDEMMQQQFEHISGAPLKAIIRTTSTDPKGKKQEQTTTTEVTELREEDVDDGVFAIPADYEKVEFMGQDSEQEEKENPMSKLKGLFKKN